MLRTNSDYIVLVTGCLRQLHDGGRQNCLKRFPWSKNPAKGGTVPTLKTHWKLCTDEAYAKQLWNFWFRCGTAL